MKEMSSLKNIYITVLSDDRQFLTIYINNVAEIWQDVGWASHVTEAGSISLKLAPDWSLKFEWQPPRRITEAPDIFCYFPNHGAVFLTTISRFILNVS